MGQQMSHGVDISATVPTLPCICETRNGKPLQYGQFVFCTCGYKWMWTTCGWRLYITENKPFDDIQNGEVFSGNPKAPCGKLPYYSGSTGQGVYVKILNGALSLSLGCYWDTLNHMIVEGYKSLGNVKDLHMLIMQHHKEHCGAPSK